MCSRTTSLNIPRSLHVGDRQPTFRLDIQPFFLLWIGLGYRKSDCNAAFLIVVDQLELFPKYNPKIVK